MSPDFILNLWMFGLGSVPVLVALWGFTYKRPPRKPITKETMRELGICMDDGDFEDYFRSGE